jgi:hypothetical protein
VDCLKASCISYFEMRSPWGDTTPWPLNQANYPGKIVM